MPEPINTCAVDGCDKPMYTKKRGWCKMHQSRWDRHGSLELPTPPKPGICEVEGCGKVCRSTRATLCVMHYHRQYRHGDVNRTAAGTDVTASNGRRYRAVRVKDHPLADSQGRVYEHRFVLYGRIGTGAHPCHWCDTVVRWEADRWAADSLQVDHLNNFGDDNRPENLVPSCRVCNSARGAQARAAALREAGWWSVNDTIALLGTRSAPVEERRAA